MEIICINDGTPDDSMAIVRAFADRDDRIKIINKENGGLSDTRNVGIDNANGAYIYFIDSDDYLEVKALEMLYVKAVQENLDIVYFDTRPVFETSELEEKFRGCEAYYSRKKAYDDVVTGQEKLVEMAQNNDVLVPVFLQFFKRSFIRDNNIKFYKGILHEDNLFSMQVAALAQRVSHINECLHIRRIRPGSIMTGEKRFANSYGYFICEMKLVEFLKGRDVSAAFGKYMDAFLSSTRRLAIDIIDNLPPGDVFHGVKAMPPDMRKVYEEMVLSQSNKKPYYDRMKNRKRVSVLAKIIGMGKKGKCRFVG